MKKIKTEEKPNIPKDKSNKINEEIFKENLLFQSKFNQFFNNDFENRNNYIKIYSKIVNNEKYLSELNFDPKRRLDSIVDFSLRKRRINKDYLNNIFISHIEKVTGYFHSKLAKRIYLVDTKGFCSNRDYRESIFVNESLLMNRIKAKYIESKCLDDKKDNLDIILP